MGTDAVAVLHVTLETLREYLDDGDAGTLVGADGAPMPVTTLDDGVLLFTQFPLADADSDQIAIMLRDRLGDALDEHDDEHGVLVFPSAVKPKATTYAAVVAELGELGEWAPVVEEDHAPPQLQGPLPGGLDQLIGGMMRELGPDIGEISRAMMGGDPAAMEQAMARVQQAVANSGGMDQMMSLLGGLSGPGSPLDLDALQTQAKQALAHNPELAKAAAKLEQEAKKKK